MPEKLKYDDATFNCESDVDEYEYEYLFYWKYIYNFNNYSMESQSERINRIMQSFGEKPNYRPYPDYISSPKKMKEEPPTEE